MGSNSNDNGLVNEKMYSIQVGCKTFKLSGASLLSDSPSYFTRFFSDKSNSDKVLFIDRSPEVFEKIYLHLQGYYINIIDEYEFVYLFSDADYFDLPGLKTLLFKNDFFIRVGNKSFRISRDLITSEGNYPNYFSVTFNALFIDPLHAARNFIRPPPLKPPVLSNHSADLFEELLSYLQGKSVIIANEKHREDLMRECRYYRFLALEQKLIKHRIRFNPFNLQEEIIIDLKDIKKDCFQLRSWEVQQWDRTTEIHSIVQYSRPYLDKNQFRDLILQIEYSQCTLQYNKVEFSGNTAEKINSLLQQVATNVTYDKNSRVLSIDADTNDAYSVKDGERSMPGIISSNQGMVTKAQYRVKVKNGVPWLEALNFEVISTPALSNRQTAFI